MLTSALNIKENYRHDKTVIDALSCQESNFRYIHNIHGRANVPWPKLKKYMIHKTHLLFSILHRLENAHSKRSVHKNLAALNHTHPA